MEKAGAPETPGELEEHETHPHMKIAPTDADYQEAVSRLYLGSWAAVKDCALRCAAGRLLKENSARTHALLQENHRLAQQNHRRSFTEYRRWQDEIDRLFSEHDQLLDIAYPNTRSKEIGKAS